MEKALRIRIAVEAYDLDLTLQSGQVFRWQRIQGAWIGVVGPRWVRLQSSPEGLAAETSEAVSEWSWLSSFLQTEVDLEAVLDSFPRDNPMKASLAACRGLRLLRQDPWECLASFILSACKQIVQIQQIIQVLCGRYGKPVPVPRGFPPAFTFPSASCLADRTEQELRDCKMGWRARPLLETSRIVAAGGIDLNQLHAHSMAEARERLLRLPGVGPKIADCVLLFACGFQEAFPIDVWINKALRQLYFAGRNITPSQLRAFPASHFGAYAGYAQQYLFHYMRTQGKLSPKP